MSLGLVSYGSSSSEESDDEESNGDKPNVMKPNVTTKGHSQKITKQYLSPSSSRDSQKTKFVALPPPLKSISTGSHDEDGEYNTSKSKLALPPPKRRGSAIKIPAPALPEPDSDDDELEEPQPKKTKSGKKISSLFAMLPEPKHATLKQTNRILVPHTLTKKKPEPAVVQKPPPPPKFQPKGSTFTSENDELSGEVEGGNFFSLDSSVEEPHLASSFLPVTESGESSRTETNVSESEILSRRRTVTTSRSDVGEGDLLVSSKSRASNYDEMIGNKSQEKVQINQHRSKLSSKLVTASVDEPSEPSRDAETVSQRNSSKLSALVKPELNEQPLSFSNQNIPYGYQLLSSGSSSSSNPAHDDVQSTQGGSGYSYDQQDPYHQQSATSYDYPAPGDSDPTSYHSNTQDSSLIHDKAFQKMIGRGNFDPSAMNIIDVNADDHIGKVNAEEWMLKSMTEEKEAREDLKKEQVPTHQQKKKHQITYLARQARERELELKNSWAQNRMTRKATQAKYGF